MDLKLCQNKIKYIVATEKSAQFCVDEKMLLAMPPNILHKFSIFSSFFHNDMQRTEVNAYRIIALAWLGTDVRIPRNMN